MSIYTKKGDQGKSSTYGGKKISKDDLVAHALGAVDELNSIVGVVKTAIKSNIFLAREMEILGEIQYFLLSIGSEIGGSNLRLADTPTENLEKLIDHYQAILPGLSNFIIPGGSLPASQCQLARAICRRAERSVAALNNEAEVNPNILKFLNRLSDFLFVMGRWINHREGYKDEIWRA
jgi:cob(I)alamin adenosyltransferase